MVTIRAWVAATRLARLVASCPISRNDRTVVSSQKTYITMRLSETTSPSIAPANATKTPANRPSPGSRAPKYRAQYTRASAPTPLTSTTITHDRVVTRSATSSRS